MKTRMLNPLDDTPVSKITVVTRRDLLDHLRGGMWHGDLDELAFLSRIYDLSALPSTDRRYSNAAGDIETHRVQFHDWDDDWIFSDRRFRLSEDEKLLGFLCEALHPLARKSDEATKLATKFNELLRPDGYEIYCRGEMSGRPVYGYRHTSTVLPLGIAATKQHAEAFNLDYIAAQTRRMEASIESDPELSIGTAKELIETCCKTVLTERGATFDPKDELIPLVKATASALSLNPKQLAGDDPLRETISRILGNLSAIAHNTAELRNAYGTGHGKQGTHQGLEPRHARLVVGAATTLVVFLFDTHRYDRLGFHERLRGPDR